MRVLSIIHYPVFGGPHNRNVHIATALKSRGVATKVLLPDEPGNALARFREAGIDVTTARLSRLRASFNPWHHVRLLSNYVGDVRRIRNIIRRYQIDLVQLNGLVNSQGAVAARLERVPVVWQILDTFPPMSLRRAAMVGVRALADVVMCTGYRVAEAHPGALNFGERLVLFSPPVNLERFSATNERRSQARRALGLSETAFVVGNVGNLNPQKGHETFIRAAAELKQRLPEAQFVILGASHPGHTEYASQLWQLASTLGLKMDVDLIVRDGKDQIAFLEQAFDVFWMTSQPMSEGIPTAIEEAMALGIPVVSTDVGAIGELVQHESTGFLVKPRDCAMLVSRTIELYSNESLRQSMKHRSLQFAREHLGVEACADRHMAAYELATGRGKASGDRSVL